jgi:muramidase (phage lysozyme)
MRSLIRSTALAGALMVGLTACTPEQILAFLHTTGSHRHVLSQDGLARLRTCEATGDYGAVSASGTYRGAYQFDRRTWNDLAARTYPWLVGVDPAAADPWWQDAMARALWSERGRQPWPHCGRTV